MAVRMQERGQIGGMLFCKKWQVTVTNWVCGMYREFLARYLPDSRLENHVVF